MKETFDVFVKVAKTVFSLNIIAILIVLILHKFSLEFLYGLMFGSLFSLLNFRLISIALEKAIFMDESSAQIYVFTRYIIRMIITSIIILISIKAQHISLLGTILGLLMPKLSVFVITQRKPYLK
ncbi:ATP synthase I chain [Alkalithermobacter thermoalcaliphilus JW-YL-7 = DSM 7308]|uniref:ATP synthase I chain n=2 Tax=Clostridium paradoxum TaxID=29346 RepID=A0A150FSE3_CLOPD|nr:ATP synthase subunit I [[Clostridium] paradoxum] [[Clostridium] paradoxum JW-YL-7 = DSM 7308]KXZ40529.1 ATP synthase I chain [[Clostridium] paradoxum JW-YL-7 = DSM 7308]SHK71789.1 ATP synthase I chain [[Clostridium] paradoxum JW-YL-7 = DSM 7308]